MASILAYARLSNAVYEDDPQLEGWTRTAFKPSGEGMHDAFQGAAFTRNGELVFACKGTSNLRDAVADLKLGVGMNTSQFSEAQQFIEQAGVGSANLVTFCGHSLGGAIAQIVGNRLRTRFVTFNAPGIALMSRNLDQMAVAVTTGSMYLRLAGSVLSAVRHPIQAAQDIGSMFYRVSGVNFRLGKDVVGSIGVHYGQVIEIPYRGGALDVGAKHKIGTMIEALEDLGYDQITLSDLLN